VIGSPWLIFNYRLFGSIMPISGISESLDATFGANLIQLPAPLFDFMTLVLPIPLSLRTKLLVIIGALVVIAAIFLLAARMVWTSSRSAPYILAVYGLLTAFVVAFYGTYFGAPYFMSRYLAVLSPVLAIFGVIAAYRVLDLVPVNSRRTLLTAMVSVVIAFTIGLNVRLYRSGLTAHEHFQVVTWVRNHVPPETWVGAPQSGTLGYFHDRTINLDGKVDPDALRARLRDGDVISYVLRSKIVYLVDWVGLASWANLPKGDFKDKFKLIVEDKRANLAVLERVDGRAQPLR
jgi:hypothetical protein